MPYQGKTVSITEMLDTLASHWPTEAAAGLELERAFEDKAIRLFAPAGRDSDGEQLWREISNEETSALIVLLRDLCNRAPTTTIGTFNLPIELFKAARAIRLQFETACRLSDTRSVPAATGAPIERKDAVRACIEEGMLPAKTTTWDRFCERVRDLSNAWIDKKEGTFVRGFDEKTIRRDVKEIMN
jgi:hypothetical protein